MCLQYFNYFTVFVVESIVFKCFIDLILLTFSYLLHFDLRFYSKNTNIDEQTIEVQTQLYVEFQNVNSICTSYCEYSTHFLNLKNNFEKVISSKVTLITFHQKPNSELWHYLTFERKFDTKNHTFNLIFYSSEKNSATSSVQLTKVSPKNLPTFERLKWIVISSVS